MQNIFCHVGKNLQTFNHFTAFSVLLPEKQSMREAIEHLLARYLDILPLFLAPARPMKVE